MITSVELRKKYLEFFKQKKHAVIASASLIPENDPTVLFNTAGMQPLVPYLMGEKHPEGKRLAGAQKCLRTVDIDEVGDKTHCTFFEMLGNWSLGDYFKEESIKMSWEFLTSPEWLGLDVRKLAVTVFAGDNDAPRDIESAEFWQKVGLPEDKIAFLPKENNWWGPAGITGPCGPDTEIFYWIGENAEPPIESNPGNDEDNWVEIWNNVFLEYNKQIDGKFLSLEQKNVDTGMGFERAAMVLNDYNDVYQTDTFWPVIQKIQEISGCEYPGGPEKTKAMRIIADHIRAAVMIIGDQNGVGPSNTDQGYIVRRLLRRAVRQGHILGITDNFCSTVAKQVISVFKDVYPEVEENRDFIFTQIADEESKFRNTLEKGLKEFDKLLKGFETALQKSGKRIDELSGKQAFKLYDTYGFPLEMTKELAKENGLRVDENGFAEAMEKHQELSRQGAEKKFKGGLADNSEMSAKYHTATHLLHAALRKVLGEHVEQRGSNITAERLRFDFFHPEKMTQQEKSEVEKIVNEAIERDYSVSFEEMTVPEAKESGAIGLFEDRYGNRVKVYTVGDPGQKPLADPDSPTFSKEICGGPHAERTGLLGKFQIKKEEASSAGVRRIKAVLEN